MKKILPICVSAACAVMLCSCGGGGEETPTRPVRTTGQTLEIARPETTAAPVGGTSAAVPGSDPSVTDTGSEQEVRAVFSCGDITSEIMANVSMSSMAEVGADRVSAYIDFEIPEGTDFSMFICGSGGFADEVCVINTAGLDADAFSEAVDKRINARMTDFEDYNPDEYDKLSEMLLKQTGDYLIYAVTGDNEECERIFDEFMNR